ncbi:DASH complex, subunit Dad3, partial [Microstroma glucosiphilum]
NPYLGHRHLSAQQAQLLGEYYRLSQTLKRILALSGALSATKPHAQVLDLLRLTERKMGLVITLFKASVWSIMVEQEERNRA